MSAFAFHMDDCTSKLWERGLASAEQCALQQDWGYGLAIRDQGHKVHHARLMDGERIVALAQIAERQLFGPLRIALLMRGPVWTESPEPELEAAFLELIRDALDGAVLLWTPEKPAAKATCHKMHGHFRVVTGYSTLRLSLAPPLETIRAGLHGKWRNMLHGFEKGPLVIRQIHGGDLLDWVIERNEAYRQQVRYAGPSPDFIRSLGRLGSAKSRKAWVALQGKHPVAGMIAQKHGHAATYYAGCTTAEGRLHKAHHGLMWAMIKDLKQSGVRSLDLGGVDTERAPGVARFKLGIGAEPIELAGTYLIPPGLRTSKRKGPRLPAALSIQLAIPERAA